jgi:hypothetical protein
VTKSGGNGVLSLLASLLLGACVTTNQTSYKEANDPTSPPLDRQVIYHLDRAFYEDPPGCVVVMPSRDTINFQLATMIEDSIARHLTMKMPRIIGSNERKRLERELAIDISSAEGQQRFGQITNCRGFLDWRALEVSDEYALVFSSRSIGLAVEMTHLSSDAILWSASHVAQRWDGGVPLSLTSIAFSAFEAAQFHGDQDILPSMVDDVVRRIFVTLPELR